MLRKIKKQTVIVATLAALLLPVLVEGAAVKPLEVFTERIIVLEVERLANDHAISAALAGRALERLNKRMNIMSQERVAESLKILGDARQAVAAADRSAATLSEYIKVVRPQLKEGGHDRFLPLAGIYEQIENPYYVRLERFLATATDFIQYCSENLEAISTGQKVETLRYDELYAAYLRDMEEFNQQSVKRSKLLTDWSETYPPLMEFLPR